MAETVYSLTGNVNDLLRWIQRDCRCVKAVEMFTSPESPCCKVRVVRIDSGVWEWNDNVIA